MKLIIVYALSIFIISSTHVHACELTNEYKEARSEITKHAIESHANCESSVSQVKYWHAFTQCIERRDDMVITGNCDHIVSHNRKEYEPLGIDDSFCDILSIKSKKIKEILKEHIKEKGIKKCK